MQSAAVVRGAADGRRAFRSTSGTAATISESLGTPLTPCLRAIRDLRPCTSGMAPPFRLHAMSSETTSAMQRVMAVSWSSAALGGMTADGLKRLGGWVGGR